VIAVYKSEVIKKTLDPSWKEFDIPLQKLNNGNFDMPLIIEVFDWNANGDEDFIGSCAISLR
jgi:Ca2+-dependent lipid-binding protein